MRPAENRRPINRAAKHRRFYQSCGGTYSLAIFDALAIDWAKFSGGKYKHFERPEARQKLFLADARQKGRMKVWEKFEANQRQA